MAEAEHLDSGTDRAVRAATRGALISMVLILVSRLTGLGRDIAIAAVFGQGRHTDCYYAALQVPDLLHFLIAGGVLGSSFMPVYAEYRRERGDEAAWELCSVVFTLWTLFAVGLVALSELFAPQLVRWLAAPGFPAEDLPQVVALTRIVLPAQVAFFSGGVLMGVQWVHRDFVIPGIGPSLYNLGILAGGIIGGLAVGPEAGVVGLAWGALAGAFVGNLVLQFVGIARYAPRLRFSLDWRHPGARRVLLLMLPVIFSLSLPQVDVQINRWFASWLPEGSMTALDRAYRLMLLPVGIFGQAVAVGFYATLTNLAAEKRLDEYRSTLIFGLRQLGFVALPATALLIVLRVPIVALVFQHGQFDQSDTQAVAGALALYAVGVWCWCAEQLLGRAFYALQDTRTPVYSGTVVTVIFVGLNALFMRLFAQRWGAEAAHLGLALSTSVSAALYVTVLLWRLRRRMGRLGLTALVASLAKSGAASVALGAAAWAMLTALLGQGVAQPALTAPLAGGAGLLVFAVAARMLRMEEAADLSNRLTARLRRR